MHIYHIAGCFPLVQIFLSGEPLAVAEISPVKKFTIPTTEKSHMNKILCKVYMDILCYTCMSTVIRLFIHAWQEGLRMAQCS